MHPSKLPLNNLGEALRATGQIDQSIAAFRAALAIDEELKDRFALAYDFRNLASADAILIPRLARRLAVALDAYRTGQTRYIEHGATATAPLPN